MDDVERLRAMRDWAQEEMARLRAEVAGQLNEIEAQAGCQRYWMKRAEAAEGQLAELQAEHDAHNAAATQYEQDICELRAQLAEAEARLDETLSALEDLAGVVGVYGGTLRDTREYEYATLLLDRAEPGERGREGGDG